MAAFTADAVFDRHMLAQTPIGRLGVIPWAGGLAVAVMHDLAPMKPKRIIHMLRPGENPLNAIYGKRTRERAALIQAMQKEKAERAASLQRERDDMSKDTQKDVERQLSKSWDGSFRDALCFALGMRKG